MARSVIVSLLALHASTLFLFFCSVCFVHIFTVVEWWRWRPLSVNNLTHNVVNRFSLVTVVRLVVNVKTEEPVSMLCHWASIE